MSPFRITLRRGEPVAERTMAFHFERPSGFQFKAGQTLDLTIVDPPETDADGNTRTFSIASAPQDADIFIATRMRGSAFKRVLASAPPGLAIDAEGPMGSFTLHHNVAKPAVFLAGGIGITPFHSMIHDAAARKLAQPLWLFYSNHRPEDAPFLDDLQNVANTYPSFHFVPTMTRAAESKQPWRGETGPINREMMARHLSDLSGPVYYVAGPPGLVTGMREMLLTSGIDEDDVRSEEFSGY
jgi:ferredoxin-NADP reductase